MNQSTTTNQSELSGNENGMVALLAAQFEFSCCCSLLSRANPESKPTTESNGSKASKEGIIMLF